MGTVTILSSLKSAQAFDYFPTQSLSIRPKSSPPQVSRSRRRRLATGPTLSDRHVPVAPLCSPCSPGPTRQPRGIRRRIRSESESEATAPSLPVPAGRRPPFLPLLLRLRRAQEIRAAPTGPWSPTRPSSPPVAAPAAFLSPPRIQRGNFWRGAFARVARPRSCRGIRRGSWLGLYPAAKGRVTSWVRGFLLVVGRFIPRFGLLDASYFRNWCDDLFRARWEERI